MTRDERFNTIDNFMEQHNGYLMDYRHLIYALKDGELIHISEADRGLACGCRCPACGEMLVARKGPVKVHHFAHYSSQGCRYA